MTKDDLLFAAFVVLAIVAGSTIGLCLTILERLDGICS